MAKKGGIHLIREYDRLRKYCEELEIQNRSFGFCLSAFVIQYGTLVDDGNASQYVLRIEDFLPAENTNLTIETLGEVDGEPGTIVKVIHSKKSEDAGTDGKTQEESGIQQ